MNRCPLRCCRVVLSIVLFFVCVMPPPAAEAQTPAAPLPDPAVTAIWRNPDLPTAQRVSALISQLTPAEKDSFLYWLTPGIARLGIPEYDLGNEALHGVVRPGQFTNFPESIGLGATFDPALVHTMASAISDEARAKWNATGGQHLGWASDVLIFWSPVVNMARDPRWGRTQETYGEDPWLTGRLGVAFVQGLQGDDPRYLKVVSTPKHFASNNQEAGRGGLNIVASQRYLQEYEFAGFRACIEEGKAESIMAAYTAINGVPSSCNKWLLTDVLRKQWGFNGYVVSDCGAVSNAVDLHKYVQTPEEAIAAALNAGLDLEGGGFSKYPDIVDNYLQGALKEGLVTQAVVDNALTQDLTARFKLGMYDPPASVPYSTIPASVIGSPEHIALSRKLADESMVLLKNAPLAGQPLLPIDTQKVKSIVVVGPYADTAQLGGYSGSPTITPVTPLAGLRARAASAGITVSTDQSAIGGADLVIAVMGLNNGMEAEGEDRNSIEMPADQETLIESIIAKNPRTVVVMEGGSSVAFPWIAQNVPSILEAWYPGEEGGDAIADVLFGDYNPAGRLPLTFYASDAQLRPMDEYDLTKGRTYMYLQDKPLYPFGFGLSYTTFSYSKLRLSKTKASTNDHVIVSVDVANTGNRDGDEVVQCYVHAEKASVPMPIKQLWSFQRISIPAGATKTVSLAIDTKNFGHWDTARQRFVVEPGIFDILVGSSSNDIRETDTLKIRQEELSVR